MAATISKMWSVLKFWSFPGGLHKPTLQWNTEKWSLACQGGCYPWDRAPFKVPSDRHFGTRKFVFRQLNFIATKMNKRSMGHILTWGKQIISINKSEFIIMLINKRKNPHELKWFFIRTNLNHFHTRMLCAKFVWNWPSGDKEIFNSVKGFYYFIIRPHKNNL